jgi:SAM-dependent methyltransferase
MIDDDIRFMKEYWDSHARNDPFWAVLSDPAKDNRRWDSISFFETGKREISILFYQLRKLGIPLGSKSALDFGCGLGRLSQALAPHFDQVVGLDISETMIRLAGLFNQAPDRVRYMVNEHEHLNVFPDDEFDFICSNIVLQHIKPNISLKYLEEFVRVLRPAGLMVFQLPSHPKSQEEITAHDIQPLPEQAYAAVIRAVEPIPPAVRSSSSLRLGLEIINSSCHTWRQDKGTVIRVGNHWLNQDAGSMLIQDDGRADLPLTLSPGESCLAYLTCTTPPEAGCYICEIDLVHESISWFKDKGSIPLRLEIIVRDEGSGDVQAAEGRDGNDDGLAWEERIKAIPIDDFLSAYRKIDPFPMNGIPREIIEDFFQSRECEIIRIEEDAHSGKEWMGYRYFIRKCGRSRQRLE